jgi:diacylglycerol kinase (ATP)
MNVAVVAHAGKTFDGGLAELRRALRAEGIARPSWREVRKSAAAGEAVASSLREGAELLIVWGGDGMVQRSVDALDRVDVPLAVIPAGTSNLFATNLGIERDIGRAVRTALRGERRLVDVGRIAGERFTVMAGVGFDAALIRGAGKRLKRRLGRGAYVLSTLRNLAVEPFEARIKVDGERWYRGPASCVLVGNMGTLFGGLEVFAGARADDGLLDLGVLTAQGIAQMAETLAYTAVAKTQESPFVRTTRAASVGIKLDRKVRYELDGGDRRKVSSLKVRSEPRAITVCVPPDRGRTGRSDLDRTG